VVAGTEAVEASTAAPSEPEAFTEVEPFVPVALGGSDMPVTGEGIIHVADTVRRR
jgi:hypothetical protein